MNNIDLIKFNSKYSLDYINSNYILSRLRGVFLVIKEEDVDKVLESGVENMSEQEFSDYVDDYQNQ